MRAQVAGRWSIGQCRRIAHGTSASLCLPSADRTPAMADRDYRYVTLTAPAYQYVDESALVEDYFERGWTDGLPIVPPTPERVATFVAASGLASDTVLGEVPTREVVVTVEQTAINA